ncbi:MAG TPA: S8 family serine peptidase, partial [Pyrinomonadaceae bacterium]|nr:S8 family serine peptidase [Pyrinomonadaceae bacterium]
MKRKSLTAALVVLLLCPFVAGNLIGDKTRVSASETPERGRKAGHDLRRRAARAEAGERVSVVIQPRGDWSDELETALRAEGAGNARRFQNFPARVLELPASAVANLEARADVAYVSLNREVRPLGHVSATSGADAVRAANGGTTGGLDGTGVGIAIIDSGIDATHRAFLDKSNNSRVVFSRDFTGENRAGDPYGHGTHVASTAAGNGRISNGQFTGVAPNANLIDLRVLNSQGTGSVASLLEALDWVLTNRVAYNIRVVNMSLGGPAVDSYRDDPVCRAVRRLVDAGVVIVAAAGNNGKDGEGRKVYGQVHSPGNEPSALTVGAANSFGTDARGDDRVTSYSSRGPTRSFWTDADGVRHYDNLVKPDLVAPGNKLVFAQATNNALVAANPSLDAGVSPVDERKMMYLNGTSRAAPVAAGAAALV